MRSDRAERSKPTLPQRVGLRQVRRKAGKRGGEPLSSEDWAAWGQLNDIAINRALHRLWKVLPSSPRCGICGAPFAGPGRWIVRPLGFAPSRKNPTLCAACVETSPPGGMKMQAGILFADLRGFTARFDGGDPEEASIVLRRFYRCAEDVLFPDAVIDKLIGDEVMALYLPDLKKRTMSPKDAPAVMLEHARGLLRAVGYGSGEEPFVELGIGLDIGEAFVGNIGQRALYDFTAVGDVVNTASRLQAEAGGGEIMLSDRVANGLATPVGTRVELALKGKPEPQIAYRMSI
jgi:adenylate cyclase